MNISKNAVQLSVNNPSSGEGIENISAKFNSEDLSISFNSRYLTDIASQIENENIVINLRDPGSPVLINDFSDKNTFHVVMPMKIWIFLSKITKQVIFIFFVKLSFNINNNLSVRFVADVISHKKMLKYTNEFHNYD